MKTGIIQQHNTADRNDNMRRLADKIKALASEGAELVVLQELHNSLYFCQTENVGNFDLAEPIPGPSTDFSVTWQKSSYRNRYIPIRKTCGRTLPQYGSGD